MNSSKKEIGLPLPQMNLKKLTLNELLIELAQAIEVYDVVSNSNDSIQEREALYKDILLLTDVAFTFFIEKFGAKLKSLLELKKLEIFDLKVISEEVENEISNKAVEKLNKLKSKMLHAEDSYEMRNAFNDFFKSISEIEDDKNDISYEMSIISSIDEKISVMLKESKEEAVFNVNLAEYFFLTDDENIKSDKATVVIKRSDNNSFTCVLTNKLGEKRCYKISCDELDQKKLEELSNLNEFKKLDRNVETDKCIIEEFARILYGKIEKEQNISKINADKIKNNILIELRKMEHIFELEVNEKTALINGDSVKESNEIKEVNVHHVLDSMKKNKLYFRNGNKQVKSICDIHGAFNEATLGMNKIIARNQFSENECIELIKKIDNEKKQGKLGENAIAVDILNTIGHVIDIKPFYTFNVNDLIQFYQGNYTNYFENKFENLDLRKCLAALSYATLSKKRMDGLFLAMKSQQNNKWNIALVYNLLFGEKSDNHQLQTREERKKLENIAERFTGLFQITMRIKLLLDALAVKLKNEKAEHLPKLISNCELFLQSTQCIKLCQDMIEAINDILQKTESNISSQDEKYIQILKEIKKYFDEILFCDNKNIKSNQKEDQVEWTTNLSEIKNKIIDILKREGLIRLEKESIIFEEKGKNKEIVKLRESDNPYVKLIIMIFDEYHERAKLQSDVRNSDVNLFAEKFMSPMSDGMSQSTSGVTGDHFNDNKIEEKINERIDTNHNARDRNNNDFNCNQSLFALGYIDHFLKNSDDKSSFDNYFIEFYSNVNERFKQYQNKNTLENYINLVDYVLRDEEYKHKVFFDNTSAFDKTNVETPLDDWFVKHGIEIDKIYLEAFSDMATIEQNNIENINQNHLASERKKMNDTNNQSETFNHLDLIGENDDKKPDTVPQYKNEVLYNPDKYTDALSFKILNLSKCPQELKKAFEICHDLPFAFIKTAKKYRKMLGFATNKDFDECKTQFLSKQIELYENKINQNLTAIAEVYGGKEEKNDSELVKGLKSAIRDQYVVAVNKDSTRKRPRRHVIATNEEYKLEQMMALEKATRLTREALCENNEKGYVIKDNKHVPINFETKEKNTNIAKLTTSYNKLNEASKVAPGATKKVQCAIAITVGIVLGVAALLLIGCMIASMFFSAGASTPGVIALGLGIGKAVLGAGAVAGKVAATTATVSTATGIGVGAIGVAASPFAFLHFGRQRKDSTSAASETVANVLKTQLAKQKN